MKSNYKRIGDFIQLVDERNIDFKVKNLLGLSISKEFIPSVANIIGADMENYKIIKRNQFACSTMQVRRDKKMPIALLNNSDEAIISAAYPVFEVIDTEVVLPEYLMMWFRRSEFDREACFYAIGGVRGSIEWEDFCNMKLPVPSVTKQKEIVKECNVLVERINLINLLIQNLEEASQAIYKKWFVDFDFPNENSKPYKSSNGEMEFNKELDKDIPKGWEVKLLQEISEFQNGYAFYKIGYSEAGAIVVDLGNINILGNFIKTEADKYISNEIYNQTNMEKFRLKRNDLIMVMTDRKATMDLLGKTAKILDGEKYILNQRVGRIRVHHKEDVDYLRIFINSTDTLNELKIRALGSVQKYVNTDDIKNLKIIMPNEKMILKFNNTINQMIKLTELYIKESILLEEMLKAMISKMYLG